MKKGELKELIKEALVEILPEVLMIMNESIKKPNKPSLVEAVTPPKDLSLLRSHIKKSIVDDGDYDDIPSPIREHVSYIPTPNVEKAVVEIGGKKEEFVSGQGIMDWFKQTSNHPVLEATNPNRGKDIDSFISEKLMGRKNG